MARTFLGGIHGEKGAVDVDTLYSEWAQSYEQEVTGAGYITPSRCAEVLRRLGAAPDAPILDFGCGTGLSGRALHDAGFTTFEGADITPAMLSEAESRPGIYSKLHLLDPEKPLPFEKTQFQHILAAGVITPDHAPPETMDSLLGLLPPGGLLVFSLNDHALSVPAFPDHVDIVVEAGLAICEVAEAGPHLPAMGIGATVYGLRKT